MLYNAYVSTDLPVLKTEEAGITVKIFGSWTGATLSLQSTDFEYVLGELDVYTDVKVCGGKRKSVPTMMCWQ